MIEKIEIMKFPKLVFRPFCGKKLVFLQCTCASFVPELASCPRFELDLPYKEKSIEDRYSLVGYVTLVTVSYE